MSTTLPNDTFAPTATEPLFGRGAEYDAVLSFVQDRLTLTHCKSLFVFGACGTGKTSTVLRALRAVSDRVMSLDKPQRTLSRSRKTPRRESDALDANWEDASEVPMASRASVLLTKHPRLDADYSERTPRSTTVRSSSSSSTSSVRQARTSAGNTTRGKTSARSSNTTIDTHGDSEATDSAIEKYTMPYFTTRYAALFTPKPTTRTSTRGADTYTRRVQGHYVNCADLSAAALLAAILESLRVTYPRPDAEIRALREAIEQLGQTSVSPCRTSAAAALGSNERLSRRSNSSTFGSRSSGRRSSSTTKATNEAALATNAPNGTPSRSSVAHAALQVIVLDEVEYARPAARATISALATLSATSQHAMLALIFISNQRDLVHVPQMLLHELPFQAYSVATLRYIAERCMTAEVSRLVGDCKVDTTPSVSCATRRTRTSTTRVTSTSVTTQPAAATAGMQISPSLYEYIARKALLDFSGDVRQVCAMCRHVVRGALGTSQTSNTTAQAHKTSEAAVSSTTQCNSASMLSRDSTTLTSLVDTYEAARMSTTATPADTPSANRASTLSSSSSLSTTGSSPAALTSAQQQKSALDKLNTSLSSTSPAAAASSSSSNGVNVKPCTTITLASSVAALKQNAVEEQLHQHVATMPEQMLYVLCCLIVLTLRNVQLHTQAITAIGGCVSGTSHRTASSRRVSTSSTSSRSTSHGTTPMSTSLKVREVHQLYTALMGQRHFPSMNGAGVRLAIDGLADLGILTRPQRRGNEEVFSFNGVWSVTAVQAALAQRGEALRREMAACGLDGSENKFVTVLCDLKSLAHVTQ